MVIQLANVEVRIADADAHTTTVAPDGLHVWLDPPGGDFRFNHYTVRGGHLRPARGRGTGLEPAFAYWCAYATADLHVQNQFGPVSPWPEVPDPGANRFPGRSAAGPGASFGYPLPARIRDRKLILPNRRRIAVRCHNLTGDPQGSAVHLEGPRGVLDPNLANDARFNPGANPGDALVIVWVATFAFVAGRDDDAVKRAAC